MNNHFKLFPAKLKWPSAINDLKLVPNDSHRIKLKTKAKNFDEIHTFKMLEDVWCSKISERDLEQICTCSTLQSLYIENLKAKNISVLQNLEHLKILSIEDCSSIHTLTEISSIKSLEGLSIVNFSRISDIKPLSSLKNIHALAISGSMWKRMEIKSFKPLRDLKNLKYLHLTNIISTDESLRPLANLKNLQKLELANFYPLEEFAKLSQDLPRTECSWFQPYVLLKHLKCKKCHNFNKVMLTGKGEGIVCKNCQSKKLQDHLIRWEKFKNEKNY